VLRLDKIGICDILPFSSVKTHKFKSTNLYNGIRWTRCSHQNCERIVKDQKSANAARHQLGDLSRKIYAVVHPVYTSQKIKGQFKPKEHNSNCESTKTLFIIASVVCAMQTRLASRVDIYINVRKNISYQKSATTKRMSTKRIRKPLEAISRFWKKCRSKLDYLIFLKYFLFFVNFNQNWTNRVTRSARSYLLNYFVFYRFNVLLLMPPFSCIVLSKYFRVLISVWIAFL